MKNEELNLYREKETLMQEVNDLFDQQVSSWELAQRNFLQLEHVQTKSIEVGGVEMMVQFNPSRIVSSAAKVDSVSIRERKCFLCLNNLPVEQKGVPFGSDYMILVNPFPIFRRHFTIPAVQHTDQLIAARIGDMLAMAHSLSDCVIFYNGPKCGASAPDHMHFQAGNRGFLPLEKNWNALYRGKSEAVIDCNRIRISRLPYYPHAALVLESTDKSTLMAYFEKIYNLLPVLQGSLEPMLNLLCWFDNDCWTLWVFPRKLHRPWQYAAAGDDNLLISPASVDLGGVFITPLHKDFIKISSSDIVDILGQVSMDKEDFDTLCSRLSGE